MGFQLYKVFEESFPEYQFVDGRGTFNRAKAVKCQEEIHQIKRACAIAEAGMQVAIENLRPGLTEIEVSAMIHNEMVLRGSEGGPHPSHPGKFRRERRDPSPLPHGAHHPKR